MHATVNGETPVKKGSNARQSRLLRDAPLPLDERNQEDSRYFGVADAWRCAILLEFSPLTPVDGTVLRVKPECHARGEIKKAGLFGQIHVREKSGIELAAKPVLAAQTSDGQVVARPG